MRKVLIPTKLDKFAAAMLEERGYNVVLDTVSSFEDAVKANSDAEALIVRSEKVTPEVIDQLPQLKLIVRAGAGYNTIDIKYARSKDIDVMNTPGANSNGVAEEVVAMMLAGSRFLVPADISTRAGLWEKSKYMGKEVTGKKVVILGIGCIGQLVVKRLAGFEVEVLGYDPFLSPALAEKLGVELASVEKIFAECDYITLHIPENDETRGDDVLHHQENAARNNGLTADVHTSERSDRSGEGIAQERIDSDQDGEDEEQGTHEGQGESVVGSQFFHLQPRSQAYRNDFYEKSGQHQRTEGNHRIFCP